MVSVLGASRWQGGPIHSPKEQVEGNESCSANGELSSRRQWRTEGSGEQKAAKGCVLIENGPIKRPPTTQRQQENMRPEIFIMCCREIKIKKKNKWSANGGSRNQKQYS